MVLRIILAEAELELVPDEIAEHPAVQRHARATHKQPGHLLLDRRIHAEAIRGLFDAERRGHSEVIQYALSTMMESPLNRARSLQVSIHTRNQRLIHIRPETRLPRGDQRFQGVMGRVLYEGASHDEDPLIWVEGRMSAKQVLDRCAAGPVLRLDERGVPATTLQIADQARGGELTLVLGGFPKGDWGADWAAAAPTAVSIWPDSLNTWAVAAELVAGYRARHGPHRPR